MKHKRLMADGYWRENNLVNPEILDLVAEKDFSVFDLVGYWLVFISVASQRNDLCYRRACWQLTTDNCLFRLVIIVCEQDARASGEQPRSPDIVPVNSFRQVNLRPVGKDFFPVGLILKRSQGSVCDQDLALSF